MSLYLWLFFLTAICAACGANQKYEPCAYAFSFICLTAFLALRYAQGADWPAYNYIFVSAPNKIDFSSIYYTDAFHSEIGWKLINNSWRSFGFNFTSLSVIVSLVEMVFLNRFLTRYSTNRALSLLLTLPVVYLIYFFSAMRQGLVIAIFLGFMVPILEKGHLGQYVLLDLLLATIHSVSLLLLIIPLFIKLKNKNIYLLIVICAILGIGLSPVLRAFVTLLGITYESSEISPLALVYRLIMYSIVVMLYSGRKSVDEATEMLFKCYSSGLCIYLLFCSNELMSSRFAAPQMAIECALIASLLRGQSKQGLALLLCIITICSVMYLKNISTAIDQSGYVKGVSAINYPYISIFNSDDIFTYSTNRYLPYLHWN